MSCFGSEFLIDFLASAGGCVSSAGVCKPPLDAAQRPWPGQGSPGAAEPSFLIEEVGCFHKNVDSCWKSVFLLENKLVWMKTQGF